MNGVRQATNTNAFPDAPATSQKFWAFNAVFWGVYAGALMIPWLDRYSVLQMLPNKLLIASTGVAVTGMLRAMYPRIWSDRIPLLLSMFWSFVACAIGALAFDLIVVGIIYGPDSLPLGGSFGALIEGVPMTGRVGQYLTLLIAWSLGHHLLSNRVSAKPVATSVHPIESQPSDATLSISGTKLRLRDGSRTILLERNEVEWIAADGDYIRLHFGARNLLIRATMKHTEQTLKSSGFVRVHRSAIVNQQFVREVVRDGNDFTVVLRNGAKIRAGRNYANHVRKLGTDPVFVR